MLNCRIRGVEVWNNNEVEREIGSGSLPPTGADSRPRALARAYFFAVSYFMPAPMLNCRIRGDEVWVIVEAERELGSGSLPPAGRPQLFTIHYSLFSIRFFCPLFYPSQNENLPVKY